MIILNYEQNSPEWHQARSGKPTASEFKSLLGGNLKPSDSLTEYARKLAIECYTGRASQSFGSTYHTRRGHELEPIAAEEYELINDVSAIAIGFIVDDQQQYGCSPDRLINGDGVLEIKCLSDKEHLRILEYFDKHGDIPPGYIPQLQGEMFVTERNWNDILFFHPDLPSLTHRVLPSLEYVEKLQWQLKVLFKERNKVLDFLNKFSAVPRATEKPKSKLIMEI